MGFIIPCAAPFVIAQMGPDLCKFAKNAEVFSPPRRGRFSHFHHDSVVYFFLVYQILESFDILHRKKALPMHPSARLRRILPRCLPCWSCCLLPCPGPAPPPWKTATASRCSPSTRTRSSPSATRPRASAACTPCATPAPSWTGRSARGRDVVERGGLVGGGLHRLCRGSGRLPGQALQRAERRPPGDRPLAEHHRQRGVQAYRTHLHRGIPSDQRRLGCGELSHISTSDTYGHWVCVVGFDPAADPEGLSESDFFALDPARVSANGTLALTRLLDGTLWTDNSPLKVLG